MDSAEMTAGPVPADPGAEAPAPVSPDEERPASRRKLIVLLLMLLVFLLLALVAAWYLLFHKPLTELPVVTPPQAMPAYQGSLYNLSKPQAVAVSADATRIVMTQTGTSLDTVMFDRQGDKLAVLAPPADQVPSPHQLFVATDPATGEFWATDRFNGVGCASTTRAASSRSSSTRVQRSRTGSRWRSGSTRRVTPTSPTSATGRRSSTCSAPTARSCAPSGAAQNLDHPNGIAVADDGTIYVTDTGNGQLKVFDASGTMVGSIDRGAADGNLGLPVGVAIDDHGNVLVVDSSSATRPGLRPADLGAAKPRLHQCVWREGQRRRQLLVPERPRSRCAGPRLRGGLGQRSARDLGLLICGEETEVATG